MGLFGKKDPCAICGGKVKGLFSSKIDGQYVCDECYGTVDLPAYATSNMTIETFKEYMAFREENAKLKEKFVKSEMIDFGLLDTKLVFDYQNKFLCLDKNLNATIFEGKHIVSFSILEDTMPLFEGNPAGLRRYVSTVPSRVLTLAPMIDQFLMKKRMNKQTGQNDTIDIPEPFRNFNLVIRFEHPYWNEFKADMGAPFFLNNNPSIEDYMRDYNEKVATMEKLARALMKIAFNGTAEQLIDSGVSGIGVPVTIQGTFGSTMGAPVGTMQTAGTSSEDAVEAIRKFKDLLDQGLITEEEFNAKKRQILGI